MPDGYFTATSTSYVNWIALRGFLVDGRPDAASQMFRNGIKIYPLARRDDPPAMEFLNASGQTFNTIHANNAEFYEEVHTVIDREPVDLIDPETRGLLASIGIRKGQPFEPDEQLQAILVDAAAVANATARAAFFQTPVADNFLYEGSYWKRGFFGGNYEFLLDGGGNERNLDARTAFFYMATVNTPAMAMKMVGRGSQYACGDRDSTGNYLDGANDLPAEHPGRRPGQGLLVDRRVRPADPFRAADRATLPEQEQHQGRLHDQPRRVRRPLLRARAAGRPRGQLDPDRARQGLVHHPAPLRPARSLVRPDLATRRDRTDRRQHRLTKQGRPHDMGDTGLRNPTAGVNTCRTALPGRGLGADSPRYRRIPIARSIWSSTSRSGS